MVANVSRGGSARQRTTNRRLRALTGPAAWKSPHGERTARSAARFDRATSTPS
jgi:hypothetical protein